jgi:hypothetical protein
MNCEDEYQEHILHLAKTAQAIEEAWVKESDDNKNRVSAKPSMGINGGDYRAMGWIPTHPDFSYGNCARCDGSRVVHRQVVAGCRRNGDGYGSDIKYCETCGFFAWTSYDEA